MRFCCLSLTVAAFFAVARPAAAQTPREARAIVTVVDATGAVLPGAVVTVTGIEAVTNKETSATATASDLGLATVAALPIAGGALPPKAFIKSIRIMRDTFPVENHSADNDGIDIITQAGVGAIRGGLSSRVRDSVVSGRNPFVDVTAPERTQHFDGNLGATIVPRRATRSDVGFLRPLASPLHPC